MHAEVSTARSALAGWLCPTEMARMRFVDMNDRVRTARRIQGATLGAASLLASFWYGPWLAILVLASVTVLVVLEKVSRRTTHPEVPAFLSLWALAAILALGALGTGGATSPMLVTLAVPTLMLAARYRKEVVVVGVVVVLLMSVAVVLGAQRLAPPPTTPPVVGVAMYLAVMASLVAVAVTLQSAEMASRGDAVVDQLTGLFNRKALHGRFTEAAAQAKLIGAPVSLIMCDLDHFKRVNDEHGHDVGDVVLREVAYRMRCTLRVFDMVYRLGGEEFLVLLPGQTEEQSMVVADRMLADMRSELVAGLPITMSAGVAALPPEAVDFDELLKAADLALYAAKRAGRDRACAASEVPTPTFA